MSKLKEIARLDLASYRKPVIPGNRSFALRAIWYLASAFFFQGSLALLPSSLKSRILRAFGATIGTGVVIKPRVTIKYPWFLEIGDHVWIGELVWIDNHTTVQIGSNSCLSQGAVLFTGNHDWNDPAFAFFCKPVIIGDSVWITAFQRVPPGTVIPPGMAFISGED